VEQLIAIHPHAPAKPRWGEPCNGCGVCCAAEPCPVGQLRFRRRHGACPALAWDAAASRYRCGLLVDPQRLIPGLPRFLHRVVVALLHRQIAAGRGCDFDATVE
jgi:Fe-S-cluster-containing hydrogenase component 2